MKPDMIDEPELEPDNWLKHRMECSQCEHAYYVHSKWTWYCIRHHELTEGYCEYETSPIQPV